LSPSKLLVQFGPVVSELDLLTQFQRVRERTQSLCAPLSAEDALVQSMPDASPAKWHLAHTTWFFEQFVLAALGEPARDPAFMYLFNSYYEAVGERVSRAQRGLMTRPGLSQVLDYRKAVNRKVCELSAERTMTASVLATLELGVHHEQQHQELLLTDIKHALGTQALRPAYRVDLVKAAPVQAAPLSWAEFAGGVVELGVNIDSASFTFDCERPRHRVVVQPYRLATRPLCNAEVLAFIADGGYADPRHWLSDGWATVQREGWRAPLYWEGDGGDFQLYTLGGMQPLDPAQTACHLSYYEADAIARWLGARLPTEAEWEHAAAGVPVTGHFAEDDVLSPRAATGDGLAQLFGDVWEWTQSAFAPYPGYRPLAGALGEYNGKFMANQFVLRGGSCFTPSGHVRASYRNFFPASARWQMTGLRLADDGGRDE